MTAPGRLGVSPHLYCRVLTAGLEGDPLLSPAVDVTTRNAIKLRERELDAAFLSPLDYARESSDYLIVPGVAVASPTADRSVLLRFRKGLHTISTLAIDPSSTSEIILAKIVLAEQYELEPALVPVAGTPDAMLRQADAALLVGDAALQDMGSDISSLDLIEEWLDLADLPYVHGFWCGRESSLSQGDRARIQSSRDTGVRQMEALTRAALPQFPGTMYRDLREYVESFSYGFPGEVRDGLHEFLKYVYYHGLLPDVAEITFYPTGTEHPDSLV